MASTVYTKLLASAVADNGTVTFDYAAGKDADDYSTVGHTFYSRALQASFPIDAAGIAVDFGVTEITVTYQGATTIPAGSSVSLDAVLLEAQEEFGDFTINDLVIGGEITLDGGFVGPETAGTVTTTSTTVAEEHGDNLLHTTKLTMTAFAVGTTVDSVNLAIGAKFYTLPAGSYVIESASIAGALTGGGATKTDTPEVGIGTVIASGAVATLATGTFENVIDGGVAGLTGDGNTVAPDINGTAFYKGNLSTVRPVIEATGGLAHDLFFNVADGWAATSAGVLTFTGVVTLVWRKID
jgi:hypothetical protein